jgi:hypothetical protein
MKLQKEDGYYYLMEDGNEIAIATTDQSFIDELGAMKLSKQNCDEIFEVVNVEDIRKAVNTGIHLASTTSNTLISVATEQSSEKLTEIEVEIDMDIVSDGLDEMAQPQYAKILKVDENNCLILKKK